MSSPIKVLAIHGVGRHEEHGPWTGQWTQAIEQAVARVSPSVETQVKFVFYADLFDAESISAAGTLEAIGKLAGSGIRHGLGGLVGNWFGRSRLRARGLFDIPDLVRWTAGMVVQWAENERLRKQTRDRLAAAIDAEDPDIVLAHSLGSLVVYDTVIQAEHSKALEGRTFVSFGSQIGNPFVRSQFAGRIQALNCEHWYHLYNLEDDVFTSPIRISAPNFEQVDCHFDIAGVLDHDAIQYLGHENFSSVVWGDLFSAERSKIVGRAARSEIRGRGRRSRRALLIGINDYPAVEARLEGCVNDVFLMSAVLQEMAFEPTDIRTVLNERATADGIRERIEWLLDGVQPGDERVLYYSGHGAQITDYGLDEAVDRKDECLVPWDFDWSRPTAVTDDWLHELYSQIPYDAKLLIVLDCCHSGGMARGTLGRPRGISPPDDVRHREMAWDTELKVWKPRALTVPNPSLWKTAAGKDYLGSAGVLRRIGRATDVLTLSNRKYDSVRKRYDHFGPYMPVMFQACQEQELAYEYRHGVTAFGAFTYAFAQEFRARSATSGSTFKEISGAVAARLKSMGYEQMPGLVGPASATTTPIWLGGE